MPFFSIFILRQRLLSAGGGWEESASRPRGQRPFAVCPLCRNRRDHVSHACSDMHAWEQPDRSWGAAESIARFDLARVRRHFQPNGNNRPTPRWLVTSLGPGSGELRLSVSEVMNERDGEIYNIRGVQIYNIRGVQSRGRSANKQHARHLTTIRFNVKLI